MYPDRPTKLDAALLYYDYDAFSYVVLVARLQAVFGDALPIKLGAHEDGVFAVISAGPVVMMISQNKGPLGTAGFDATLKSPFTKHTKPDAANMVQNHRKNIFVTVGDDAILAPDFAPGEIPPEMAKLLAEIAEPPVKPNQTLHANRVYIAQMVILELCKMNQPELIHWVQSDQLLTAREFDPANDPSAMALQMHPVMYSTGNDKQGRQKIGFDAFGSEHIMGHHVTVDETALLFEDVYKATQGFVHAVMKSGTPPPSGKIATLKSGAKFMVHHMEPNDRHPRPYLRLEVLETGTPEGSANAMTHIAKTSRKGFLAALFGGVKALTQKYKFSFILLVAAWIAGQVVMQTDGLQMVSLLGN